MWGMRCMPKLTERGAKDMQAKLLPCLTQDVIVSERRFQYEADVKRDPLNYDAWFDYIRLEESAGQPERARF